MTRLGFVTCRNMHGYRRDAVTPELSFDDGLLARHLERHGIDVVPVIWGESIAGKKCDALVIRSPWDYVDNVPAFMEWLDRAAAMVPVFNPPAVVRWNLDKRYLGELGDAGAPIVPTRYVSGSEPLGPDLVRAALDDFGAVVLKPCVSAGARDTFRFHSHEECARPVIDGRNGALRQDPDGSWRSFQGGRDFMLQPFIAEVSERGEWSLVYLGGRFSHAVLKRPKRGDWLVQDEYGGEVSRPTVPRAVRELGDRAATVVAERGRALGADVPHLYARIDLLDSNDGPLLGEVELFEPDLFFRDPTAPELTIDVSAGDNFATAVADRLG